MVRASSLIVSIFFATFSAHGANLTVFDCKVISSRGWFSTYSIPPPAGSLGRFDLSEIVAGSGENIAVRFSKEQRMSTLSDPYISFQRPVRIIHPLGNGKQPATLVRGEATIGQHAELEVYSPDQRSHDFKAVYRHLSAGPVPLKNRLDHLPNNVLGNIEMQCWRVGP